MGYLKISHFKSNFNVYPKFDMWKRIDIYFLFRNVRMRVKSSLKSDYLLNQVIIDFFTLGLYEKVLIINIAVIDQCFWWSYKYSHAVPVRTMNCLSPTKNFL